jgi:hypothetical protein
MDSSCHWLYRLLLHLVSISRREEVKPVVCRNLQFPGDLSMQASPASQTLFHWTSLLLLFRRHR